MDRSSKERIKKDIVALKETLDQMHLIDIYRTFHPKETKYTLFLNAHGTLSKIDYMKGHKTILRKVKKIEIISSTFLEHNGLKLETSLKEKNYKTAKNMETEYHVIKQ